MKQTILKDLAKINVYIPEVVPDKPIEPQKTTKKARKTNPAVEAFKQQLRNEAFNKRNKGVK